MEQGFDNGLYTKLQIEEITKRLNMFDEKLYMEFGGKIFDDFHASRVLPGFDPNAKIKILATLKEKTEIIFIISAKDIEKNKIRADYDLPYSLDVLRLIDKIRKIGITVSSIVITLYSGQPAADVFQKMLEQRGEKVYIHTKTKGYPTDVETIVSDEGYGINPYITTTRPLVVVAAPGPGSGKLGTCLSQLYHEYKRGKKAGFAKFETFPIWNIPLKHPVNIAYEAATIDLKDINMIDPFHLYAYNEKAINYNRDIEAFPLLQNILAKITGNTELYKSPTDMGVNMAGFAITNDKVCQEAAKQEIIRRYLNAKCDFKRGLCDKSCVETAKRLMDELDISVSDRKVVAAALQKRKEKKMPAVAIKLKDGTIITGRENDCLTASSSVILNALKHIANINDEMKLLTETRIRPIIKLKENTFKENIIKLELMDVLIMLAMSRNTNQASDMVLSRIGELSGCEAHATCILASAERIMFKKLGINMTTESEYETSDLFIQ